MRPSRQLNIDLYPYAYFAGLWGYENPQDNIFARGSTGCVVTVSYCPVLWMRKLQTETAIFTMETEYFPLV